MAVIALDAEGVAVSTRSACDIDDEEPSHWGHNVVRITLLPDASFADARRIAKTLASVAKRYRTVV